MTAPPRPPRRIRRRLARRLAASCMRIAPDGTLERVRAPAALAALCRLCERVLCAAGRPAAVAISLAEARALAGPPPPIARAARRARARGHPRPRAPAPPAPARRDPGVPGRRPCMSAPQRPKSGDPRPPLPLWGAGRNTRLRASGRPCAGSFLAGAGIAALDGAPPR